MASLLFFLALMVILSFRRKKRPGNKVIKVAFVGVVNLFIVELFCYGYLVFMILTSGGNFYLIGNQLFLDNLMRMRLSEIMHPPAAQRYAIYRIDKRLGYSLANDKYMRRGLDYKATNSQGLRNDKEYSFIPSSDKLRMAVFGDSFVFCDGELTQATWASFLERSVDSLEVLNFGVSGYGLGQSYLRYLTDGVKFHPDIVFSNYISVGNRDTIASDSIIQGRSLRNSDVYRAFFWLKDGIVYSRTMTPFDLFGSEFREKFIYNPLGLSEKKGMWANKIFSFFNTGLFVKQAVLKKILPKRMKPFQYYDEGLTLKILENWLSIVKRNNSTLLFFCGPKFSGLPIRIQLLLQRYSDNVVYVSSRALLERQWEHYGVTGRDILNHTNHYTARGNQMYAEALIQVLIQNKWDSRDREFQFDRRTKSFRNRKKSLKIF